MALGLGGALLLTRLQIKAKALLYAVLVSPILAPGIVLGISDLHLLEPAGRLPRLLVDGGAGPVELHLRLLHADLHGPPAALRHHAGGGRPRSRRQPAPGVLAHHRALHASGASSRPPALAFLQSFENYTTTYFAIGAEQTFTIFIANKVRQGVTPAVNAVAVVLVVTTVAIAIAAEIRRRNAASRAMEAARLAQQADVEMAGGLRPQEAAAQ